jgi:hypothetical protein
MARELTVLYPDPREAIQAIERARMVHRGSGSSTFVDQLAVAEASVLSRIDRGRTVDAVVKLREGAQKNRERGSRVVEEARKIDLQRDAFKKEMRDWNEGFSTFLQSLDALFSKTEHRLRVLDLRPEAFQSAIDQVEDILSAAIKKCFEGG